MLQEERIKAGLTQEELAEKLGLKKSAVAKYENGRVENIKRSIILRMSEIFDCVPSYLLGFSDNVSPVAKPKGNYIKIKIFGTVPAGTPLEAIEDVVDVVDLPASWLKSGYEYIGLQVHGDSMYPRYLNKDKCFVYVVVFFIF